jgi:hypothetical protein
MLVVLAGGTTLFFTVHKSNKLVVATHKSVKTTSTHQLPAVHPQPTTPSPPPPITYTDPKGYFTLQYPGDWVEHPSTITLGSVGGDTWLERFNLVPADQAHSAINSPDYNAFVECDVVEGPSGDHIVSVEKAGGEQFTADTESTINNYPAVYTQQNIANTSTIDTYIISNLDIAIVMNLTVKETAGANKEYPSGFDRTAYTKYVTAILNSVKFLNTSTVSGYLPGTE